MSIVKCIIQLFIIKIINEFNQKEISLNENVSSLVFFLFFKQFTILLSISKSSYEFSRSFNSDLSKRLNLWKKGSTNKKILQH